jgi:tripartite-type tricarboxylate transporter receptor subunit TctC
VAMKVWAVAAVALIGSTVADASRSPARSENEEFPSRPITLVVPFAPGGLVDLIARVTAQGLSDEIGKPVTVENRPGGGGTIGVTSVAKAAPNGYTLLALDISFVSAPQFQERKSYSPTENFKMVGSTGRSALALVVSPALKAGTLADFISFASKPENNATFAHAGVGSTPHLAAVSFAQAAKLNPLMVPYGGMTPATNDLIGNRVTAGFVGTPQAAELTAKGMLTTLGVTSQHRVASNKNAPTFNELGLSLAGFERGTWYGIAVPAGTPDVIVQKLNAALNSALKRKGSVERLALADVSPFPVSPTEFQSFVADQSRNWGTILSKANHKAQ